MLPENIRIEEFDYQLPEARIAKYPLAQRDQSKLLVYENGQISDALFHTIPEQLKSCDILVSNNTRVISARLFFRKKTGAVIEVFCLEPINISHQEAMLQKEKSVWKCLVGGAKKWKGDEKIECRFHINDKEIIVSAAKLNQAAEVFEIEFNWAEYGYLSFSEILFYAGELPLPPYFNRQAESSDYERYQTVFAYHEGSVAAPTAGLHFTGEVLSDLKTKGIAHKEVTLHVGAGTFKPVSSETMKGHTMHSEFFSVHIDLLNNILKAKGRIIAVGTTSMRTLESLYWLGVKILNGLCDEKNPLCIEQWEPYQLPQNISSDESLNALIEHHQKNNLSYIAGATSILIAPGYSFKICSGIITNFHIPKSTLLLLVAAFVGEDWKKIYDYALLNDFRFLSYGDSSLLWKRDV